MPSPPDPERVEALSALLDRHRRELHAVPAVTATGIGLAHGDDERQAVIQVFVRSEADRQPVEVRVSEILGDAPVRVIVSGEIRAGNDGENAW